MRSEACNDDPCPGNNQKLKHIEQELKKHIRQQGDKAAVKLYMWPVINESQVLEINDICSPEQSPQNAEASQAGP